MDTALRVLIVGGGIAGMSLAIRLGEGGLKADLIDADPEWRAVGTGISITGPTFRAFAALGVEAEVRASGSSNERVRIFQPPNHFVGEIGPPLTSPPLPNNGGILRPVLHNILSARTRACGTQIRLGTTVTDLIEQDEQVQVTFGDGTRSTYDLVVGADGSFSDMRARIFPNAAEPEYTGQGCFRHQTVKPPEIDSMVMYVGGPVKTGVTPCGPDSMYLFCNVPLADNPRWDPSEDWIKLKHYLEGYGGIVATVRERLHAGSNIVYRPLESFLLPAPWYSGRVVLIGDAAHATTPHLAAGAMMAVEDALVLSELLVDEDNIAAALARFMQRRFERCRMVVENSAQLGQYEIEGVAIETHKRLQEDSWQAMAAPI
jgi:2-polyprenyl-6-methoxyphenol hydroxylase-like FAD-dependent oxidoreductase